MYTICQAKSVFSIAGPAAQPGDGHTSGHRTPVLFRWGGIVQNAKNLKLTRILNKKERDYIVDHGYRVDQDLGPGAGRSVS
jgi:hypothetical protein